MTILKGYERKTGSFTNKITGENIEYDNYVIHYVTDEREEVTGWYAQNIKCKAKSFQIVGAKSIDDLLEKEIMIVMDPTAATPTVKAIVAV